MFRPNEDASLPRTLQDSITRGECVAFIGSGVSCGCYDPWDKLVNDLCAWCGSDRKVSPESSAEDYQDAAEDAKQRDVDKYHAFLGNHFGRSINLTSPTYRALLSCPFKSYLTTNFDPLLKLEAEARKAEPLCRPGIMAYPHLDRQYIRDRTVYYLHGLIKERSVPTDGSIVLARSEFKDAYNHDSPLRNFLVSTLLEDPICFIGCRLRELREVLAVVKEQRTRRIDHLLKVTTAPIQPPVSYILLPYPYRTVVENNDGPTLDEDRMAEEDDFYGEFGITTHRYYTPTEEDHSALRRQFETLAGVRDISVDFGWNGGNQQYGI